MFDAVYDWVFGGVATQGAFPYWMALALGLPGAAFAFRVGSSSKKCTLFGVTSFAVLGLATMLVVSAPWVNDLRFVEYERVVQEQVIGGEKVVVSTLLRREALPGTATPGPWRVHAVGDRVANRFD